MDFDKELEILFEYSDYDLPVISILKQELRVVHQSFTGLWPSRGWSSKDEHSVGLVGHIEVDYNGTQCRVPFGICYPIDYPKSPPQCNIITQSNHIIILNSNISAFGSITVNSIRNWTSNSDSVDVILECINFLSKTRPWFNLDDVFISELWRLRNQIDDLNKDKILLKEQLKDIENLEGNLDLIESGNLINEIKEACEKLESEIKGNLKEFDLDALVEYKKGPSKQLLQVLGEIEALDEIALRLEDAHLQRVISSVEYILNLKRVFYDKFMLQKLKEKIVSVS